MDAVALLAVTVLLALGLAALHQWVLDSPLFELGEVSWFPGGGDISAGTAVARSLLSTSIPVIGTLVAATLVVTTAFQIWVWGLVAILAVTVLLSPVLAVYRYDVRHPTPDEARLLAAIAPTDCEVLVVSGTGDGPVNGYAIGGPFRNVVGVSEFALSTLQPAQVEALLAHEACHHREKHVLVRSVVSLSLLSVGALIATARFETLTGLATLGLVLTVFFERVLVYWVMRRLEYRADAVAAQRTSADAVQTLLAELDDATDVDQARVSWPFGLFSTHPSYAKRISHLREQIPARDSDHERADSAR